MACFVCHIINVDLRIFKEYDNHKERIFFEIFGNKNISKILNFFLRKNSCTNYVKKYYFFWTQNRWQIVFHLQNKISKNCLFIFIIFRMYSLPRYYIFQKD